MKNSTSIWLPYKPSDTPEIHLLRASILVRATQGQNSVPTVFIAAAVVLVGMWRSAPHQRLLIWLALVCGSMLLIAFLMKYIRSRVAECDEAGITRLKWVLLSVTVMNNIIVGTVFWWLGIDGSPEVVFAITLIACLYCFGAMVNLSVDVPSFTAAIVLNLGQGILFFSGVGHEPQLEIAASIAAVAFLLERLTK